MKEERMVILNMLENGVISAQEAERLLFALQQNSGAEKERFYRNVNKTVSKAGGILGSLTKSLGDTAEKLEPKVKRAAEKFTEKASVVVDDAKTYAQKLKEKREQSKEEDWFDLDEEDYEDVQEFLNEEDAVDAEETKASGADEEDSPEPSRLTKNLESYMNTIQVQMDQINDAESYLKEAFGLSEEESMAYTDDEAEVKTEETKAVDSDATTTEESAITEDLAKEGEKKEE